MWWSLGALSQKGIVDNGSLEVEGVTHYLGDFFFVVAYICWKGQSLGWWVTEEVEVSGTSTTFIVDSGLG